MDADGLIAEFGTYLDEGSARVFVGAGLSRAAGYPDWQELTKTFRQELGFRKMDDLPQLAQYYQDNVAGGRRQSTTTSPRPFKPRPLKPTRSHQLLGELPGVVYWTTNDDSLVESAINDAYPITEDQQLAQHVPAGSRLVYKMHGSIDPAPAAADRAANHRTSC